MSTTVVLIASGVGIWLGVLLGGLALHGLLAVTRRALVLWDGGPAPVSDLRTPAGSEPASGS